MTAPPKWSTFELVRGAGEHVAYVRLPVLLSRRRIIMWGAQTFEWDSVHRNYVERQCYLVPLEHMHAGPERPRLLLKGGPEK